MAKSSRPVRLRAVEKEIRQLADEYQAWHDALPENLTDGAMANLLEETIAALEDAADTVWAVAIDPPFIGRPF